MEFNTSKYQKGITHVHDLLNDLSKSYTNDKISQQGYICIPSTKKGKNFIQFNICDTAGKDNMFLFLSPQTVGVKMYNNNKNFLYDYSFSEKDGIRIVQINFANGCGARKKLKLNPETEEYELVEINELLPVKYLANLDDYSDSVINSKLFARITSQPQADGTLSIRVRFIDVETNVDYNFEQHPELLSIR